METVRLSNGFEIPVIGYGTFPQKDTLVENISIAYNSDYRMFDTSDNYGNELFVGEGLRKINKEECVIISKYSRSRREHHFEEAFTGSKTKLGKIDVYLLHWPYPFLWKYQWRQMEKLYLDGKIKAIGVCNFEVDKLSELLAFCKVPPAINQIERHPLFQQNDILDYCNAHNIKVMSYSPVARGDKELINNPILVEIAKKYNKTVSQIILRWDIDTGTIPIPGASSEKHIFENIDVFDFQLTEDEINRINQLDSGKRIRFDPKTRFNKKQKIEFLLTKLILPFIAK